MSHGNSVAVLAIARYLALVLEREIVGCFLAHQEIMFHPKNVQKLIVDCLVVRQPAQSASEKAKRSSVVSPVRCKPKVIDTLTYLKMRRTIFILATIGDYIN